MDVQNALRFVESCIDRYAEQAWRTAYVMLSNAADADDLLQQAFLVAWRKAEFAPRDNAWPWLAAIIGHEARNFRRKRNRRRGPSLDSISEPAMENDPNKNLERIELAALVHVSLAELDEDQRIAIVLTHLGGLSQTEAATALGVPLNTLKARVRRGLDSLRDALGRTAPNLEDTLKTLPVAPPIGGLIAAKAAWTAGLASNVAIAGTTTAGVAGGFKALFAASAAAVILTVGVVVAVTATPDEQPKPYVAQDVRDEPEKPKKPPKEVERPAANMLAPTPELVIPPTPQPDPVSQPEEEPEPVSPQPKPVPEKLEPEPYAPAPARGGETPEVAEAIDKACDWLKKQQGIDPTDPKPVFGKFPENPPLYGVGEPHRYLIARTAFPVQALCGAGCFVDDPAIEKAMQWLRENYTENGAVGMMSGFVGSTTYEDATVLLAVEAYYISAWEANAEGLSSPSKRFKAEEDEYGKKTKVPIKRWGTEEERAEKKRKERNFKLEKKDQKMCEIAVKALENRFRKSYGGGGWRYAKGGVGENDPEIDVSATLYAIMGLKCATRLGIKYDKKILLEVFRFLRGEQDKDGPVVKAKWKRSAEKGDDKENDRGTSSEGEPPEFKARGWGYARKSNHHEIDKTTYGSMTAAAVSALILLRDELVEDEAETKNWAKVEDECNTMIGDGMAWMINNWSMTENPGAGMYRYYYYLCAVERLAILGGFDEIGRHDWYMEGARVLLEQQDKSEYDTGMWDIQNEIDPSDIYNTCYALIFLKRAAPTVARPIPVLADEEDSD